jgi:hypothetical protein
MSTKTIQKPQTVKGFIARIISSGYGSLTKKTAASNLQLSVAKETVLEAKQGLYGTLKDSVHNFKLKSEEQIRINENSIIDFKKNINTGARMTKATYQKKVSDLEQKNLAMRKKLAAFKSTNQDKWASFELQFRHDMIVLNKAFDDFIIDSK